MCKKNRKSLGTRASRPLKRYMNRRICRFPPPGILCFIRKPEACRSRRNTLKPAEVFSQILFPQAWNLTTDKKSAAHDQAIRLSKSNTCPEAAVRTSCKNRINAAACSGVLNQPRTCLDKADYITLTLNPAVISVSMNPGSTRLTRIPSRPHSRARLFTRPSSADLEAA